MKKFYIFLFGIFFISAVSAQQLHNTINPAHVQPHKQLSDGGNPWAYKFSSFDNEIYYVGNHRLAEKNKVCSKEIELQLEHLEQEGKTTVIMGINGGSYNSMRDSNLLDEYKINFNPAK